MRNAFRPQTCIELPDAFHRAHEDDRIGVVVLTGAGDQAFCSGGDQKIRGDGGYVGDDGVPRLNVLELQRQIRTLPKPVIAMVAGYAIGGGHVLHVVCDLTIAADNAIFGQTGPQGRQLRRRLRRDPAGAHRRPQEGARRSGSSAASTTPRRRCEMGLVNTVVPLAQLEDETVQWCREILEKSPTALRFLKAAFNADTDGLAGLQQFAGDATLLYYLTEEAKEGRNAFLREAQARLLELPALPLKDAPGVSGGARERDASGLEIVEVRLLHYRIPFLRPYVSAKGSATAREGVIVRLMTEAGVEGIGESAPLPDAGEDIAGFVSGVDEAAAWALGRTATSASHAGMPPIWRRQGAGVEIAAWDALAKARGLSLAAFGSVKDAVEAVPVNALVSAEAPEAVAEACAAAAAAGFAAVKLKVGFVASPIIEIARIAAARRALGPGVKLRLDANGAWTEKLALEVLRSARRHDIEYVEQPLAPGDLATMRRLRSKAGVPIAADEDADSNEAVARIIAEQAADVIVLKPLQLGGVGYTLRAAAAVREAGLTATITTTVDSGVGTAAALHICAILHGRAYMPGQVNAAGLATLDLLEGSLVLEELPIVGGMMALPAGAGLGVGLDPAQLARYTVREWTLSC